MFKIFFMGILINLAIFSSILPSYATTETVSFSLKDELVSEIRALGLSRMEGCYHCGVGSFVDFEVDSDSKICTIREAACDDSILFGGLKIKDEQVDSIKKCAIFFEPLVCRLTEELMAKGKEVPVHCMITYCQNQIRQLNCEHNTTQITSQFVSNFLEKQPYLTSVSYATNSAFVFVVRMKAIIDNVNGNESERIASVLTEDFMLSFYEELRKSNALASCFYVPYIHQLISYCPQLIPHLMFYDLNSPTTDLFEKYYEEYCRCITALTGKKNESNEVKKILDSINDRKAADMLLNTIKRVLLTMHDCGA